MNRGETIRRELAHIESLRVDDVSADPRFTNLQKDELREAITRAVVEWLDAHKFEDVRAFRMQLLIGASEAEMSEGSGRIFDCFRGGQIDL